MYDHYFKDVSHLKVVDIYRILELYEVTDPCVQHAVKKLLCSGKRGVKEMSKDIKEASDTLNRYFEMQAENNAKA